jgi:hypothetical protein
MGHSFLVDPGRRYVLTEPGLRQRARKKSSKLRSKPLND